MPNAIPPYLSIVFSFRNEESVIPELLHRIRTVLKDLVAKKTLRGFELIFVDDASNDRSIPLLKELDKGFQDIRILTMSRTFGVSPCVMAGFRQSKGDAVIYMDCDLQDPPEMIPDMVRTWLNGNGIEVVHTLRHSRAGESPFKMFITRIGYAILNRYSNVPIPREAGDFKLLSRKVVDHILKFKEYKPFMRGIVAWVGFNQVFIPYDRQPRFDGKSKFFVIGKKVISNFLTSALVNFSSVPLQIASYCGLCAIFIDLLLLIWVVLQVIQGHSLPGWTGLTLIILFIGGVQLFCIGMIGLYLHSVHEQTKDRPSYIIASTYGLTEEAK
jgi:glycosyltransferase involved in cell wall biosynthesis